VRRKESQFWVASLVEGQRPSPGIDGRVDHYQGSDPLRMRRREAERAVAGVIAVAEEDHPALQGELLNHRLKVAGEVIDRKAFGQTSGGHPLASPIEQYETEPRRQPFEHRELVCAGLCVVAKITERQRSEDERPCLSR